MSCLILNLLQNYIKKTMYHALRQCLNLLALQCKESILLAEKSLNLKKDM